MIALLIGDLHSAAIKNSGLDELGHFFAAIALQLLSYFAKYSVL